MNSGKDFPYAVCWTTICGYNHTTTTHVKPRAFILGGAKANERKFYEITLDRQNKNPKANDTLPLSLTFTSLVDKRKKKHATVDNCNLENSKHIKSFITRDNKYMIVIHRKAGYNVYDMEQDKWVVQDKNMILESDFVRCLFINDEIIVVSHFDKLSFYNIMQSQLQQKQLEEKEKEKEKQNINSDIMINKETLGNFGNPYLFHEISTGGQNRRSYYYRNGAFNGMCMIDYKKHTYEYNKQFRVKDKDKSKKKEKEKELKDLNIVVTRYEISFLIFGGSETSFFGALKRIDATFEQTSQNSEINEQLDLICDVKINQLPEIKLLNFGLGDNGNSDKKLYSFGCLQQCIYNMKNERIILFIGGKYNTKSIILWNYDRNTMIKRPNFLPFGCYEDPSCVLLGDLCLVMQDNNYCLFDLKYFLKHSKQGEYDGYGFANRFPWIRERIIWIGYHKQIKDNKQCLFYRLPKDIVKKIIQML